MKTLVNPSTIPAELRRVPNWVCWRYEERDGRLTKVPKNPHTGANASVSDPTTWTDFDTALQASARFDGIGFVLTPDAGIVAFDFDHCLQEPDVLELVHLLDSYTEVTPSGEGLRVLCYGRLPDGRKRKGNVEMYDAQRFVTVTGNHLAGTPARLEHRQQEIEQAYRRVFGAPPAPPAPPPADLSDAELIERAMNAENGAKFQALWQGDDSGYPSPSEADCALASMLLFWTGGDVARAERLFSLSPRGQREKWRTRADYRQMTLRAALEGKTDFYHSPQPPHAGARGRNGQYANPDRLAPPLLTPRKALSLRDLMAKEFAPLTYLAPDVLPEGGLSLLVGRPKVGKSWLALQIACALSAGGFALGLDTPLPKRVVLYCALEDGLRRLQRRITLLGTPYDPDAFHIVTELSPLDRGGADELRELIHDTGAEVVFVDVVARILPRRRRNDGVYQSDYDAFAMLKDIAVAEGITLIAVHHESKAPNDDPLMRVSGSTGLTGAVDAVLTLSKPRGEHLGTLFVTGRDIEREGEYAISFTAGKWYLEGDAKTVRMSEERKAILQAIEALGGKATPKQIADYLEKNASTTRTLLAKMKASGELRYDGTHYTINTVDSVDTVDSEDACHNIHTPVDTVDTVDSEDASRKLHTPVDTVDTVDNTALSTLSTLSTPSTPSTLSTLFTGSVIEEETVANSKGNTVEARADGKPVTAEPVPDGIPDYRTAIIPLRDGVAAWCDTCGCSMLHVLTREGDWECVDCGRRRRFPHSGG